MISLLYRSHPCGSDALPSQVRLLMLHSQSNECTIRSRSRDGYLNRGLAPEGELLSFAPPRQLLPALLYLLHPCSRKESNPRKGGPVAALILRSSLLPRVSRRGSCPSADVRHPCRPPHGLFSAKTPVLGAANGIEFKLFRRF
jgi:hypothetical protein